MSEEKCQSRTLCGQCELRSDVTQTELTAEEIEEYKGLFRLFDNDGNGEITGDEIVRLFQAAGYNPTAAELQNVLSTADTDENKSINFDEFIDLMKTSRLSRDPKEKELELLAAFRKFDMNGDGVIDKDELRRIMGMGQEHFDDTELDQLMADFDTNGDGVLEYKEFVTLWSTT